MAIMTRSAASAAEQLPPRRSRLTVLWQFCRQNPLGAAGGLVVILMLVMALFADLVTIHDPTRNNFGSMLEPPSADYWLGTDQYGRDLYARIVYGARTALLVGFVSAFVGGTVGLILGVASAHFGGRLDLIMTGVMDVLMAFPLIILALAMVSIFGTGTFNVIMAITIPFIPRCARVDSGRGGGLEVPGKQAVTRITALGADLHFERTEAIAVAGALGDLRAGKRSREPHGRGLGRRGKNCCAGENRGKRRRSHRKIAPDQRA